MSIYKIVKLGLIKDGKLGVSIVRAERIKRALRWLNCQKRVN